MGLLSATLSQTDLVEVLFTPLLPTAHTQTNGNAMNSQLSPNTAAAAFAVQQQPQPQRQQQQGTANGHYNTFKAYISWEWVSLTWACLVVSPTPVKWGTLAR